MSGMMPKSVMGGELRSWGEPRIQAFAVGRGHAPARSSRRAARRAVGRGYVPDALFAATRRGVLSTCRFAEITIKSFRAVTARATFLCLCKETWRKESSSRRAA